MINALLDDRRYSRRIVWQQLNWQFQFKDSKLRTVFHNYYVHKKLSFALLIISLFATSIIIPINIYTFSQDSSWEEYLFSSISLFVGVVLSITGWLLFFYNTFIDADTHPKSHKILSIAVPIIQRIFIIIFAIFIMLFPIRGVIVPTCSRFPEDVYSYLIGWQCHATEGSHYGQHRTLTLDSIAMVAFLPILTFFAVNETRIEFVLGSLIATNVLYMGIASHLQMNSYLWTVFAWSLITGGFVLEVHFQRLCEIFRIYQVAQSFQEHNQKHYQEQRSMELHNLLSSIVVDLRAPLSTLASGMDMMAYKVQDLQKEIQKASQTESGQSLIASTTPHFQAIQYCLTNIHFSNLVIFLNINSFIDYMKTMKGGVLKPKVNTVNIIHLIQHLMDCMNTIQNKCKIHFLSDSFSIEEAHIASKILTDQEWLQENILCLLSNAVKYTPNTARIDVEGEAEKHIVQDITVNLSLVSRNIGKQKSSHALLNTRQKSMFIFDAEIDRLPSSTDLLEENPSTVVEEQNDNKASSNSPKSSPRLPQEFLPNMKIQSEEEPRQSPKLTPRVSPNLSPLRNNQDIEESGEQLIHERETFDMSTQQPEDMMDSPARLTERQKQYTVADGVSHHPEDRTEFNGNNDTAAAQSSYGMIYHMHSFKNSFSQSKKKIYATEQQPGDESKDMIDRPVSASEKRKKTVTIQDPTNNPVTPTKSSPMKTYTSTAPPTPYNPSLPSKNYLRIEVEDHGIGVPREMMPVIFTPFKQFQRQNGGTGIGLYSLAKRIEAHKGRCGVQHRSDGKRGSMFWFEIPYQPMDDEIQEDIYSVPKMQLPQPTTIFPVEDEEKVPVSVPVVEESQEETPEAVITPVAEKTLVMETVLEPIITHVIQPMIVQEEPKQDIVPPVITSVAVQPHIQVEEEVVEPPKRVVIEVATIVKEQETIETTVPTVEPPIQQVTVHKEEPEVMVKVVDAVTEVIQPEAPVVTPEQPEIVPVPVVVITPEPMVEVAITTPEPVVEEKTTIEAEIITEPVVEEVKVPTIEVLTPAPVVVVEAQETLQELVTLPESTPQLVVVEEPIVLVTSPEQVESSIIHESSVIQEQPVLKEEEVAAEEEMTILKVVEEPEIESISLPVSPGPVIRQSSSSTKSPFVVIEEVQQQTVTAPTVTIEEEAEIPTIIVDTVPLPLKTEETVEEAPEAQVEAPEEAPVISVEASSVTLPPVLPAVIMAITTQEEEPAMESEEIPPRPHTPSVPVPVSVLCVEQEVPVPELSVLPSQPVLRVVVASVPEEEESVFLPETTHLHLLPEEEAEEVTETLVVDLRKANNTLETVSAVAGVASVPVPEGCIISLEDLENIQSTTVDAPTTTTTTVSTVEEKVPVSTIPHTDTTIPVVVVSSNSVSTVSPRPSTTIATTPPIVTIHAFPSTNTTNTINTTTTIPTLAAPSIQVPSVTTPSPVVVVPNTNTKKATVDTPTAGTVTITAATVQHKEPFQIPKPSSRHLSKQESKYYTTNTTNTTTNTGTTTGTTTASAGNRTPSSPHILSSTNPTSPPPQTLLSPTSMHALTTQLPAYSPQLLQQRSVLIFQDETSTQTMLNPALCTMMLQQLGCTAITFVTTKEQVFQQIEWHWKRKRCGYDFILLGLSADMTPNTLIKTSAMTLGHQLRTMEGEGRMWMTNYRLGAAYKHHHTVIVFTLDGWSVSELNTAGAVMMAHKNMAWNTVPLVDEVLYLPITIEKLGQCLTKYL